MQIFHIRYRNTQGTLMRILNAASRRGLDLPMVQAEAAEQDHRVTLLLEVAAKQVGQLYREWYAIPDVTDVRCGAAWQHDEMHPWASPHPPASETLACSQCAQPGPRAHFEFVDQHDDLLGSVMRVGEPVRQRREASARVPRFC